MKLYTDIGGQAPSPRRVRIFIAEKGLEVALEEMKLPRAEPHRCRSQEESNGRDD